MFDAVGYRKAAQQAGIPQSIIDQTISDRTGVKGWLTEGKQGLGGVATAAGNVLNLPSYAIGGALNAISDDGKAPLDFTKLINPVAGLSDSIRTQGVGNTLKSLSQVPGKIVRGNIQGIQNKQAVFENLPKSIGVDPTSKTGMAIGLTGELLTPELPIGKLSKLKKFGNVFSKSEKVNNVFSKAGAILPEIGEDWIRKSYKLSSSDINKIAEAIGVTKESEKAPRVFEFLNGMGLSGATNSSLKKLEGIIDDTQKAYNKMVRTDTQIGRKLYAETLLAQAMELEKKSDTPQTRILINKLVDEAERQLAYDRQGVGMTDTFLRNTTAKAFNEASAEQINNPMSSGFSEQLGRAGVRVLDQVAPGSDKVGKKLRGLRTTESVLGSKARTGLGTQLVNAFKPGAVGFGVGATAGYSNDQNPLLTGLGGATIGAIANNPRVINNAGKVLSFSPKMPVLPKVAGAAPLLGPAVQKGFRLSNQAGRGQEPVQEAMSQSKKKDAQSQKLVSPLVEPNTYTPYKKRNVFKDAVSKRMGVSY